MTKEEIQKKIEEGQEHQLKRKIYQRKIITDRKEGIAFVHENKIALLINEVDYNNTFLSIGVTKESSVTADDATVYRCGYAVCSPSDHFSNKIAKGLVGYRLKNKCPVFSFVIGVTSQLTQKEILNIALCWLKMASLSDDKNIPTRLIRAFKSDVNHSVVGDIDIRYIGE